jgi:hypothetical protein
MGQCQTSFEMISSGEAALAELAQTPPLKQQIHVWSLPLMKMDDVGVDASVNQQWHQQTRPLNQNHV